MTVKRIVSVFLSALFMLCSCAAGVYAFAADAPSAGTAVVTPCERLTVKAVSRHTANVIEYAVPEAGDTVIPEEEYASKQEKGIIGDIIGSILNPSNVTELNSFISSQADHSNDYDVISSLLDEMNKTTAGTTGTTAAPTFPADDLLSRGDIDGEQGITTSDARLALRAAAQLASLSDRQREFADIDRDGSITTTDARYILRLAANLTSFEKIDAELNLGSSSETQETQETQVTQETEGSTDHIHTGDFTYNNDATCTADGTMTGVCTVCHETVTVIAPGTAKGHRYGAYTDNNDATCMNDGTKTRRCDVCGAVQTVVVYGTMRDHSFGNYIPNDDATCTANATATRTCSVCERTESIELGGTALGHLWDNEDYTYNNDVTCSKQGTKTRTCTRADCGVKETVTDTSHALLAHEYGVYISDDNATFTEDGTKTAYCKNCGNANTVPDTGSAGTHSFTSYTFNNDSTCQKDGTETAYCDDPGCEAVHTRIKANSTVPHTFGEYVTVSPANCIYYSVEKAYCIYGCGACLEKHGKELGAHTFTDYVSDNNATCISDGTKTAVCDICGEAKDIIADVGTKKPHSFTMFISNGDATYDADGTKTALCDYGCGESITVDDVGTRKTRTGAFSGFDGGTVFASQEDLLEFFNTNINRIKSEKPAFNLKEWDNVTAKVINPQGALAGASGSLITLLEDQLGDDETEVTPTVVSRHQNCDAIASVKNMDYVSRLESKDLYGASAVLDEDTGFVTIKIALYDIDVSELTGSPYTKVLNADTGEDSKVITTLTGIFDTDKSSIERSYRNAVVTAVFDSVTGKVVSYDTYYDLYYVTGKITRSLLTADSVQISIENISQYRDFDWVIDY